jgi:hypothetical protein
MKHLIVSAVFRHEEMLFLLRNLGCVTIVPSQRGKTRPVHVGEPLC